MRDGPLAVLAAHVVDDLGPAGLAEVDVNIGRRDTFGIEESFENEPEAQGTEVGDAEDVGDE